LRSAERIVDLLSQIVERPPPRQYQFPIRSRHTPCAVRCFSVLLGFDCINLPNTRCQKYAQTLLQESGRGMVFRSGLLSLPDSAKENTADGTRSVPAPQMKQKMNSRKILRMYDTYFGLLSLCTLWPVYLRRSDRTRMRSSRVLGIMLMSTALLIGLAVGCVAEKRLGIN
jgi:hypothetical protein